MPHTFRRLRRTDHARKRCLRCGFDGPQIQDRSIEYFCPNCGQDLYARPPRSYLELEGLAPTSPPESPPRSRLRRFMAKLRCVLTGRNA